MLGGLLGDHRLLAGRPESEQLEGVGCRCAFSRGIDVELEAGFGRQLERLEVQVQLPEDRVAEALAAALDTGVRGGPDPESITLETFGREIPEA